MQTLLKLGLSNIHPGLVHFCKLHRDVQVMLPRVDRFSKYREEGYAGEANYPRVLNQNSLQHTVSVELTANWMLATLRPWLEPGFDEGLLLRAVNLHEIGEMEKVERKRVLGGLDSLGDTHYIDKHDDDDLNEYSLFEESISGLRTRVKEEFTRAFLLQFAFSGRDNFPPSAREIMEWLRQNRPNECTFFQMVERWDYLLYALQQYLYRNNLPILVQVARHQVKHYDAYREVVGFSEEIWTPEFREWLYQILNENEGKWIEHKS